MTAPSAPLAPGARVRWTEGGRWFSGRLVRRLTADVGIKGERLHASPAAPLWLVETASGARAAHPPHAIVPAAPAPDPAQGELDV